MADAPGCAFAFFVRIFANCAAPLHLRIFRYKVGKPAGERCSPLHFGVMVCYAAKSLRSLRGLPTLFSYVIPHSSFLIPRSSLSSAFHCILYLCPCSCLFCHFILRFCAILLLFLAVLTLKTSSLAPFLFKLYFLYLSNENLQNRKV